MNISNVENVELKSAALELLSRREHSKYELQTKLSRRFSDIEAIRAQIDRLAETDLQSDERFVESFIRAKKSHGKGPLFIKQELRRRGVSEYLIAAYVYELDDDWDELAQEVYLKKFGIDSVRDNKDKARRIRFMVSRGFSSESVFRLIDVSHRV